MAASYPDIYNQLDTQHLLLLRHLVQLRFAVDLPPCVLRSASNNLNLGHSMPHCYLRSSLNFVLVAFLRFLPTDSNKDLTQEVGLFAGREAYPSTKEPFVLPASV
jgi:hypothetical protein